MYIAPKSNILVIVSSMVSTSFIGINLGGVNRKVVSTGYVLPLIPFAEEIPTYLIQILRCYGSKGHLFRFQYICIINLL